MLLFGLTHNDMLLLLQGLKMTLWLTLIGSAATLLLGTAVAMYRFLMPRPFRWIGTVYVDSIRSMPLVLYLVLIFVLLPIPPFERAVFAMATFNGAFVAEVIRSAIESLDTNQMRAATLLGMKEHQVFLCVALPQALARMIPALINQLNTVIKDTSLVSMGILEFAKAGEILMERAWDNAFTVIIVMGCTYFVLCLALSILGQRVERALKPWQV